LAAAATYPVRTPAWTVSYRGVAITAKIETMVESIIYTSHAGGAAPELEIELEDSRKRWQGPWFPTRGDIVDVSIGYDGALAPCPSFQVDEVELKVAPDTVHLRCIAAYITDAMRTPNSTSYDGQTLVGAAKTIAAKFGFTLNSAAVSPDVSFKVLRQNQESDLEFLQRIAGEHNYEFTIRGTMMIFHSRPALEQRQSVGVINRTDVLPGFSFKAKTRRIYKGCQVNYFDPATKKLISQSVPASPAVPTGDTIKLVRRCEDGQQAKLKAQAELHRRNMLQATGSGDIVGTTKFTGGLIFTANGFGIFDGNHFIMSARHHLTRDGGYKTGLETRSLTFSNG
jgi:phage protein D